MVYRPDEFRNYTNVTVLDILSHKVTALPSSTLHVDISCRIPPPQEALQGVDSLQGDQVYGHGCVLHSVLRACVLAIA